MVLANTDGRTDMARDRRATSATSCARRSCRKATSPSLEGTFQAQEQASRTIGLLSLVSLALIFAILYSRYRSAVLALIIMGSVPLALIGSVAALWLAGQPLSVASMIGFITLTGIAARNGILKISHYINLALHEGMPFGRELVVRGSLERLTPVLMTALSAGVALVPLLIEPASAGQGDPASGRGHDLRRADQRDAARCVSHAGPVPAFRPRTPGAPSPSHHVASRPSRNQRHRPSLLTSTTTEPGMTILKALAFAAVLAFALPALAHEQRGPNGGRLADAGPYAANW